MAMKVEVTVADIVRSLVKGVITQRVAVKKLEALKFQIAYTNGYQQAILDGQPEVRTKFPNTIAPTADVIGMGPVQIYESPDPGAALDYEGFPRNP